MAPLDQRPIYDEHDRQHSAFGVRRLYRTLAAFLPKARITKRRATVPGHAVAVRRWRRALRRTTWSIAALLLILVLGVSYLTFVGVRLDVSFLSGRIAQTFSDNIGRAVRFEGAIEIIISAKPKLRIRGFRIANPPGFGGGEFASLGEARLIVDLWPFLFHRQLRVEELAGSDVTIRLQSKPDGSNNWTLYRPLRTGAASAPASDRAVTARAQQAVALLDIHRISLENLNVEYVNDENKSHFFDLHSLEARSPANAPVKVVLNGAVAKQFPYSLDLTGGILSDLATDKPWPLAFTLSFLSSTLSVNGSIDGGGIGELAFGLGTENLEEFERLLQTELPDVGASGIAASVAFSPRHVTIKQLAGAMGNTAVTGDLKFDTTGARPKLSGSLIAKTLDLRPFLGEEIGSGDGRPSFETGSEVDDAPPANLPALYRSLTGASFDLQRLNEIDADVTLGVERWLSLPGDVKDVRLQIRLENGVLRAPLTGTMTGVTMTGQAVADASVTPPEFDLTLATSDSDLGGLAELLTGVRGVEGQLGLFKFKLAARGSRGSELVQSVDVGVKIERGRFSYGNIEGARPVSFALDRLEVRLPPGKPLDATMRGTLLDVPFSGKLSAGTLEPLMLQGRTPVDFRMRSGDARARISGTIELPTDERGPDLAFEFSTPRAGELASWFGLQPGAQAPASLSGHARMRATSWHVHDVALNLGRSNFSASLVRDMTSGTPLLRMRLDSEHIDVAELESILPKSDKGEPGDELAALDIPLLPEGIDLTDSDIAVAIKRIVGTPVEVQDVSFDGRIRDGYMHASPFAVTAADAGFSGAVLLDLRKSEPIAGLWLYSENLDVGKVLHKLGLGRDLDARFGELAVNLTARSSRLGDMLERSELVGTVGGGRIVLRDPNTEGEARITVETGELRADPGKPVRLTINGALEDVPVAIAIETAPAKTLADPKLPLQFELNADAVKTSVKLAGKIARPVGSELELALDARGERFADFDELTGASLPPWGPWSANGGFRISPRGYEVNDLRLQVGDSTLTGEGRIDTATGRPRIGVALNAPVIQLDDFKLGEWSPIEQKPKEEPVELTRAEMESMAAEASAQAQTLLSPEVLRRQDLFLNVTVEQVLSGNDKLGAGRMEAKLENGRADIGPIEVEIPGGVAKIKLGYEPTEEDVNVDLKINIEKFDFGVLARRIEPETDVAGTFSLNVDVDSRARYLSEILRHGSGRIDFAVWPDNMRSELIDIWAVNVMLALVPQVDPDSASKINCAVGRFVLDDGVLVDKGIILDTTKARVIGTATANFKDETFYMRVRPQSKEARFLSLATPLAVSGSFEEFNIIVSPGDALESVARLATSIIWVPLQRLSGKKLPADGQDVCATPLQTLAEQ
ncbi:MAG: AsmA family protein [Betaproteobacteria bacterium]|nr:MAG: AsmA family protein [Betaproteobacteria bacterium]